MAEKRVVIEVDMAKYKMVDLSLEDAIRVLEALREKRGSSDIDETLRYLRNFDEFYEYMRKKFKDYIAPPHRPDDYIRGTATIDKVKLYKSGDEKRAVIIFDRRVKESLLREVLESLGYEVEVKKAF